MFAGHVVLWCRRRDSVGQRSPRPGLNRTNDTLPKVLFESFWVELKTNSPRQARDKHENRLQSAGANGSPAPLLNRHRFMQERIDAFRNTNQQRQLKRSVFVNGTPGTGKARSIYHLHPTTPLVKLPSLTTTSLVSLFTRKSQSFDIVTLYLLTDKNTLYYSTNLARANLEEYWDVPCPINSGGGEAPPRKLVHEARLFTLQAASPNLIHTR